MLEVVGDSARGSELAFVRLAVDGDRIVDAVPSYRGEGRCFL